MLTTLQQLQKQAILSPLDVHFARFITNIAASPDNDALLLAAALTSYATTQGHTCLDLAAYADQPFPASNLENIQPLFCPELHNWREQLQTTTVVGSPNQETPLILQKNFLYLNRYWRYEQQLINNIQQRLTLPKTLTNETQLQQSLQRLFPATDTEDKQKLAALIAITQNFSIISGGPGTGKTSTVVKILALLHEENPFYRIALIAPTGKAATRLQEAIIKNKSFLNCDESLKQSLPQETATIHRLLETLPYSPYFRRHANNPLAYDIVIVDEASMIDLPLMSKLAQAIPLTAKWILLGDKDQLASVEAGTVFGDMCAGLNTSKTTHALQKNRVFLEKSYRFQSDSGIAALAQGVRQGEIDKSLQIFQTAAYPDLTWYPASEPNQLLSTLTPLITAGFQTYFQATSPAEALHSYQQFQVLCALRRGPYGVIRINQLIETILMYRGLIHPSLRWYHARPIMITRNDYTLRLFNGDIGVIWKGIAYFPTDEGELRTFLPNRLPTHETVYAMTIHKSQGSEFDKVLLLFPPQMSPVLNRELLYTGITRARQHVTIQVDKTLLQHIVANPIQRTSGLQDALWQLPVNFSRDINLLTD